MNELLQNRSMTLAEKIYQSRIAAAEVLLEKKNLFLIRSCPVCGDEAGDNYQMFGYEMRICDTCLTHYLQTCPAPNDLATYYNDPRISGLNRELWTRDRTKEFHAKLRIIKNITKMNSRIVELGSGPGQFVEYLTSHGYINASGVEVDKEACNQAKQNGIDVTCLDISSDKLPSADVYLLYEVIEHVFDPVKMVKNIFNNLSSKGRLIITTPNLDGADNVYVPPDQPNRFLASAVFPPYHINAYSVKSLFHFALSVGFKVKSITTPGSLDLSIIQLYSDLDGVKFSDEAAEMFQKILSRASGSGHLEVILEKP